MALASFCEDLRAVRLAGIGNVEVRLLGGVRDERLVSRRGVLGGQAPDPLVVELPWSSDRVLVMHTDGLTSRWSRKDHQELWGEPPQTIARELLWGLADERDDATVAVIKERQP